MFNRIFIAAFVLPALLVGADPDLINSGPGDSCKEVGACVIQWDSDTTCFAQVPPYSAICHYESSSSPLTEKYWVTRSTATDKNRSGTPPTETTQPSGDRIPRGTGTFINDVQSSRSGPGALGVPKQLEKVMIMLAAGPVETFDEKDLVARLVNDNKALWNKLLQNNFCQKQMKTQSATDQKTLDGFKWYMRQDFLYITKLGIYEANRGLKATNTQDFETSMDRVGKCAKYAKDHLKMCTTTPPNGLGIEESTILATPETKALQQYVALLLDAADKENWVMSAVAMIPCIQSYYLIAEDLYRNSVHKDTPWHKLWTEENVKYKSSTERQKTFFEENYDQWKDQYAGANEIFRKACQAEIDLWATALSPDTP